MIGPEDLIRLDVTGHQLQLLIDGLLHLEAVDVDSLANHEQLDQVHDAQILAAWLRLQQALHRHPHLAVVSPTSDSDGITPGWRPAC